MSFQYAYLPRMRLPTKAAFCEQAISALSESRSLPSTSIGPWSTSKNRSRLFAHSLLPTTRAPCPIQSNQIPAVSPQWWMRQLATVKSTAAWILMPPISAPL